MKRTLVLGIGNILLGDEGAGVHVVQHLARAYADDDSVDCMDGGTLSFTLTADIQEHDHLIIVDAARLNEKAGSVKCFEDSAMDRYLGSVKRSVHEVSLLDLMDMARLTSSLPERRALVGIEPEFIDWSETPSEAVSKAIPEAAEQIQKLIEKWRHNYSSQRIENDHC